MPSLLDRSLLYVTGKGGVGRSTVSAALGLAATAAGKRAIIVEVGDQDRLSDTFGLTADRSAGSPQPPERAPSTERRLVDDLWGVTIDPQRALEEWLASQIGSRTLVRVLFQGNAFQYFVAAAPGARELVTITKAWELAQPSRWDKRASAFDLVIVDASASGHGLGMLRTPQTYGDIARVGPISSQSARVREFLSDPERTGYVAVARPEETPVSETLELEAELRRHLDVPLDVIVVNGMLPRRLTRADLDRLDAVTPAVGPAARAAIHAARTDAGRASAQAVQMSRLRRRAEAPVTTLPFVFEPHLGLDEVRRLSARLSRAITV